MRLAIAALLLSAAVAPTASSNSKLQPRMQFPHFVLRDMIESQYRLLKEKFDIDHLAAVIGPSMGGMQTLQWGVSHPDYMDALIAIVPLAKTPAWGVAMVEASRKAIMEDPAWKDGNYDAPPEKGVRLWRDIVNLMAARTLEMYATQFKNPTDVLPWLTEQENAMMKAFDANDWIYQGGPISGTTSAGRPVSTATPSRLWPPSRRKH